MQRSLTITTDPIDEALLTAQRRISPAAGAAVAFAGIVRGIEAGAPIEGIEYEVFHEMAKRQFRLIFDQVEKRWPIESIRLVHRIGPIAVGEPSLWVEVISSHRTEAFSACQFLIDEMKRWVPIWKRPMVD